MRREVASTIGRRQTRAIPSAHPNRLSPPLLLLTIRATDLVPLPRPLPVPPVGTHWRTTFRMRRRVRTTAETATRWDHRHPRADRTRTAAPSHREAGAEQRQDEGPPHPGVRGVVRVSEVLAVGTAAAALVLAGGADPAAVAVAEEEAADRAAEAGSPEEGGADRVAGAAAAIRSNSKRCTRPVPRN